MPRIRTTSKTTESFESANGEIVYKYEVTGFNRGDMDNAKPITDTIVLHFNGAPDRKEANQKAIAEFEKKHSDCYGDTTRLLDIQNIKKGGRTAEAAPDEYARDNFLEGALDYTELKDDKGNVTLLKFYKNKYSDDFQLESYDGETQKTLAAGGLRHVVDRYGELLDMEPADAILEIANES